MPRQGGQQLCMHCRVCQVLAITRLPQPGEVVHQLTRRSLSAIQAFTASSLALWRRNCPARGFWRFKLRDAGKHAGRVIETKIQSSADGWPFMPGVSAITNTGITHACAIRCRLRQASHSGAGCNGMGYNYAS